MKTLQLILILGALYVQAQVGINTETPNQMLSVNGKVELGDDAVAPTEGTLRFNAAETDFEGYAGGEWQSMTGRSFFPKNAVPYYGFLHFPPGPGQIVNIIFAIDPIDLENWQTVPTNKYLIITSVTLQPNDLYPNDPVQFLKIGPKSPYGNFPDLNRAILVAVKAHQINRLVGENGFLFILHPGEKLVLQNYQSNSQIWTASVTAFLVDDLEFN